MSNVIKKETKKIRVQLCDDIMCPLSIKMNRNTFLFVVTLNFHSKEEMNEKETNKNTSEGSSSTHLPLGFDEIFVALAVVGRIKLLTRLDVFVAILFVKLFKRADGDVIDRFDVEF